MVVAQLVERSLPMPEVRSSNTVGGKLLYRTFICVLSIVLKDENKEKRRPGMAHFKEIHNGSSYTLPDNQKLI